LKGLLLATMALAVYLVVMTIMLRTVRTQGRAALLLRLFVLSLPVFAIVCVGLPANLGFLPPDLARQSPWADLVTGLVLFAAGFFGGILQLYNLAERGLSLRILVDILESPTGILTADEILRAYGGGQGMIWMYKKRIQGLVEHGLLAEEGTLLRDTPTGQRIARVFAALRCFLRLQYDVE
jgi:hypothetical protein